MENLKDVGKNLINLRGDMSKESVAKDLGISLSALCAYENGERMPRDEVKTKIAGYYGRPEEQIFLMKNCTFRVK